MYSDGESEQIIGTALKDRRHNVVLATKLHFQTGEGLNRSGNSRGGARAAGKNSRIYSSFYVWRR